MEYDKLKDIEYCVNFIIKELEKSLKMEKDILEEVKNNKEARYSVKIGGIKGTIIIKEEE